MVEGEPGIRSIVVNVVAINVVAINVVAINVVAISAVAISEAVNVVVSPEGANSIMI
jgi:hypothetical protein